MAYKGEAVSDLVSIHTFLAPTCKSKTELKKPVQFQNNGVSTCLDATKERNFFQSQ